MNNLISPFLLIMPKNIVGVSKQFNLYIITGKKVSLLYTIENSASRLEIQLTVIEWWIKSVTIKCGHFSFFFGNVLFNIALTLV